MISCVCSITLWTRSLGASAPCSTSTVRVRVPRGIERVQHPHPHRAAADAESARRHQLAAPLHDDGHDAAPRLDADHETALLEGPELTRARARAFREHEEAGARTQRLGGTRERLTRLDAVATVDGDEPGPAQHGSEKWPGEDLLLDHRPEVGPQGLEQHGPVEMAHVIRDDDGVARVAQVLAAL